MNGIYRNVKIHEFGINKKSVDNIWIDMFNQISEFEDLLISNLENYKSSGLNKKIAFLDVVLNKAEYLLGVNFYYRSLKIY